MIDVYLGVHCLSPLREKEEKEYSNSSCFAFYSIEYTIS